MIKFCKNCNCEFSAVNSKSLYCSKKCKRKYFYYKYKKEEIIYSRNYRARKTSENKKERKCLMCSNSISFNSRKDKKYCSLPCQKKAEWLRIGEKVTAKNRAKRKDNNRNIFVNCAFCNKSFNDERVLKYGVRVKYCSKKCQNQKQYKNFKENDLQYLASCMRSRIRHFLVNKGWNKPNETQTIIGCTFEELKTHLEKQFLKGMTWENRTDWHIDHIKPLDGARTEEDIYKLNHYTNLQPLWAKDNLVKGNR